MRIINAILLLLLILCIAVQYNDPDGLLWMVLYAIPALWTGIAAFKSSILRNRFISGLLLLCVGAAVVGVWWFWPNTPNWWQQDVWWETETAREGMGMMIILVVLLIVWFSRPPPSPTEATVPGT